MDDTTTLEAPALPARRDVELLAECWLATLNLLHDRLDLLRSATATGDASATADHLAHMQSVILAQKLPLVMWTAMLEAA